MDRFSNIIIRHKKPVIVIFIAVALVCLFLLLFVDVNYNMVDYLPPDAQSTTALNIMNSEFTESMPNASVMAKNVSLTEALEYKQKLASIDGVTQVMWLDDMMDIKQPLEMGDTDTIEGFYKDGNALFSVTIAKGIEKEACNDILNLIGSDNALTGEAPALVFIQETTASTVVKALAILLPVVILILVLSTASWLEPLLFLLVIGISIVINMGTNIIFGEISFMTNSISPILQLACSLDYAVFLLHSFQDNRKKYTNVEDAMRHAMKESMSTVAASAATTLFGFLALLFMNFGIGADLGINLAKGIIFSFISVMVFLPALILCIYKMIDKTQHRAFMPSFGNVNRVLSKIAVPAVIIVSILIVPTFLGQGRTGFLYGNDTVDPNTRYGRDTVAVEQQFGKSTVMALLVPRGDVAKEQMLCDELEQLDRITGVMSYAANVGAVIPPEYLGDDITGQFYSENYARIIVYTDTPAEGDIAFKTVENINEKTKAHYGETFYTLGQSANLYDMKSIVQKDNVVVNLIAVIAIFIVLLVTFKSATLPFLLVLTIEAGIWINLAIPYFSGTPINFLGYLVVSTIQLGATVDYAILLTNTYLRNRRQMPKREAISVSLGGSFKSILVSALTLSTAGFTLFATSSNSAIADIGLLLGRGTLLSFAMVVCFLPTLLVVFDKAIEKVTFKTKFFHQSK
ncbi:MAG TPA: MMPL family transporter [Paludibacteraceae bacterium]|nr:MMPL family transporter [Paludibacteraceae bacterium]